MTSFEFPSYFQSYLLETLGWTAVLIAAVLLLRRPVARWFGPGVAYALWAIPAVRLFLPPIELPAWMGPAAEPASTTFEEVTILTSSAPVATQDGTGGFEAAASLPTIAATTPMPNFDFGPIIEFGIALWLVGAAIFLYLRFAAYFDLRNDLMEGSRDVGRQGKVRLIETPGTDAPIAFGVLDKVIALPPGFLAQPDRTARDLALAHELAHHRGHDLLINVLVQPLFALHWWNPLGRYGWLALRRDQEAACDARVMAAVPDKTREAYANLIVRFAAGSNAAPNHALAAPMACPVLGEKSIIHRLRSLNMSDTSKSRRMAGRLALGACVLALPLTATISYAASEAPIAPVSPAPPVSEFAPPAPLAPPAPSAPPAAFAQDTIIEIDPNTELSDEERREENVFIVRTEFEQSNEDDEESTSSRTVRRVVVRGDEKLSDEEIQEIMVEVREGLAEADEVLENLPMIIEEAIASTEALESLEGLEGVEGRTIVRMSCDSQSDEVSTTTQKADGTRVVKICQTRILANALEGLREARKQISKNREMTQDLREEILRTLDQQIIRWEEKTT